MKSIKYITLLIGISFACINCKTEIEEPQPPIIIHEQSKLFEGLQTVDTAFSLIPLPKELITYKASVDLSSIDTIYIENESLRPVAAYLQSTLSGYLKDEIKIVIGSTKYQHSINILLDALSNNTEHYKLDIAPDNISITGTTKKATICGVNTLRQFLSINEVLHATSKKVLKCVAINDQPSFTWRAFMLDVARHFFNKNEMCGIIDMMAQLKLNKLHLHLTDDQGWRIPIELYPELVDSGWKRTADDNDTYCLNLAKVYSDWVFPTSCWDGTNYFGKYSKTDIQEMVAYATERGIDIVPEIDIPGHSLMAIKAHTNFSCEGKGVGWGAEFSYPLCLGNDDVLAFYNKIFDEIIQLFPSKYIHIGADEVDMSNWTKCTQCQKKITDFGLGSEAGLERWFLAQIEKNIRAKGRRVVVWDDALSMVSSTATVVWWRDWVGIDAAVGGAVRQGSEAVITNWDVMYFSGDETNTSLSDIYNLKLYPNGLNDAQKSLVIGLQGSVFTEHIPNLGRLNYMIYPRMFALSEKCWYADETSTATWNSFKVSIKSWLLYLKSKNIRYKSLSF